MNRDVIDGKWKQFGGAIKKHWSDLSDDDLTKLQGIFEQFVGFVQEKYGVTREKAETEIHSRLEDWGQRLPDTADEAKTQVVTAVKEKPWSFVIPALIATTALGFWLKSAKA